MKMRHIKTILFNLFLILAVVIVLYPILLMFMDSFKTAEELSSNPAWIPLKPTLQNYINLYRYNRGQIVQTFINSVYVTLVHTAFVLVISSLAAFAFAKYNFKGKAVIFSALLMTMMIPGELLIPPLYIMLAKIGWISTYKIQIIPGIAKVMSLFLLRQYMMSIPDSLIEAAKLDGAGHFRIYSRIIMPTSIPALATVAILEFLYKWNDYLWPLLMVNNPAKLPIMVILPTLTTDGNLFSIPWELVLTGCVVATIPIMIMFLCFSDKVMSGMTLGAVKE